MYDIESKAEWLEQLAGKQVVARSIPGGGTHFHFEYFSLNSRFSQFGDAYTNEIKHEIHPE